MRVKDVMTPKVICIDADEGVLKAARLMLQNRISGLPVLDKEGELVGIVTEGDFLRRGELGTQRQRPKWLEFILGPGKLAQEYVQTWGGKVREIMTPDPWTIGEDETLEAVVEVMERRRIKRIPVTRAAYRRHYQPCQSDACARKLRSRDQRAVKRRFRHPRQHPGRDRETGLGAACYAAGTFWGL